MSSVDDRIVNMQFNNKQFTTGAAESSKALTDLDKTIANAGKGPGLTTMGSSVDGIKTKFSALQVAGVAALGTIVSKATSVGLSLIKSLTLDPIVQGFQEYQTNLNSIQTVVSNTGESVNTVNGYMQKLNTYSDQTIYNFSQMAHNIGTFTAAGVDLQTATASIQGIANLAALSGSSADQASTAMYQLSQAIAAGRVGLQDWNSVVNAGIGGKQFQTSLASTAVAMGQLDEKSVGVDGAMKRLTINGNSFRQSISAAQGASSWLSSDVLVNTLAALDGRFSKVALGMQGITGAAYDAQIAQERLTLEQKNGVKYSDKQFAALVKQADAAYTAATQVKSFPQLLQVTQEAIGSIFSNSFAIILGDFNQSRKLWTAVGNSITGKNGALTKMGTAWAGLLREFVNPSQGGVEGGRTKILSGLGRTFRNLGKIMDALKGAFRDVFPPAAAKNLTNIGKAFNHFSRYLVLSKDTVENLRTIFAGFFSILHIGFEVLKGVFKLVANVFKAVLDNSGGATGGILSLVASIASLITSFDKWLTAGGRVSDTMGDIGTAIGKFIGPVLAGIGAIVSGFASLVSGGGLSGFSLQFTSLQSVFESFETAVTSGLDLLGGAFDDASGPVSKVSSVLSDLKANMDNILRSGGGIEGLFQSIASSAGAAAAGGIQIAAGIVSGVASGISSAAPEVWDAISTLASSIIDTFKSVLGIHSPATTMIDPGFDVIRGIVEGIMKGMSLIGQVIGKAGEVLKNAFTQLFGDMDALDFAALINSIISGGFLLALTNILNSIGSGGFLSGFEGVFTQLGNSLQAFQQALKADALLAIGTAVALLVGSLILLALLKPEQIGQGLASIAAMMGLLVTSMAALSKTTKGGVKLAFIAGAMNEMATSIVILAGAIALLGSLKPETVSQGLTTVAIALALMVGAARALSGISGRLVAAGAAMVLMSIGLQAMAVAVLMFGSMDPDKLSQGMVAVALGVGLMTASMLVLGEVGPSVALAGAAMVLMAVALQAMAVAVLMFGKTDPDTLNQGMAAMAVTIALMVISLGGLALLGPAVLAAAGAMAIMSGALVVFATAVGVLGSMDPKTLAQGMVAVAIGLALLIAAAAAAEVVAEGLLVLGAAIALIGIGMGAAGAGMFLFATGLTLLSVVGVAAIAIMVVAIEAFIALLPSIAVQVASAFVTFLETMAQAAPRVREAMDTIFKSLLGVITDNIPEVTKLLQALIDAAISLVRNTVPQWIELGLSLIAGFIKGLWTHIEDIGETAVKLIDKFLGVIDDHIGSIIDKGTDIIVKFLKGMGDAAVKIANATGQMILDVLDGIDDAITKYQIPIENKGLTIIGHLIDGMTGGLAGKVTSAVGGAIMDGLNAIGGVAGQILDGDLPGPLGRRAAGGNIFGQAASAVNTTGALINADIANDDPGVIAAQKKAKELATKAEKARIAAEVAETKAQAAEKKASSKKATQKQKAAAKQARKIADRLANQASSKADAASDAADKVDEAIDFRDSDKQEQGDTLSDRAADMAEQANVLLARAQEERQKAQTLTGEAAKKMMAQAKQDAEMAKKLADQAATIRDQANAIYAENVLDRIQAIEDAAAADQAQRDADAAFEAADQAGKLKILQDRAAASQAQADAFKLKAQQLLDQAKALAATDAAGAMDLVDQAEDQAALAKEAAEAAEQARQQAEQLMNQPGSTTGGATGGGDTLSKSILEDAASAVDRRTASLLQAMEATGATQQVTQFNQNIYSPAALSVVDLYRQTNNLISVREIRQGTQSADAV